MDTKTEKEFVPFECDDPIRSVYVYERTGSYNMLRPSDEQTCLSITVKTDSKSVSVDATWDDGDTPWYEQTAESVIQAIEERIESYWISTARNKNRGVIRWMRSRIDEIEVAYLQEQISKLTKTIERETKDLAELSKRLAAYTEGE